VRTLSGSIQNASIAKAQIMTATARHARPDLDVGQNQPHAFIG
jgi:hypothetical protein